MAPETVLIIGSGGREHALAWKLAQSRHVSKIIAVPGNPGIAKIADCVAIDLANHAALIQLARDTHVSLTMVGPEQPLVQGIVDRFRTERLPIVGPTAIAARLEGSKAFAREFMERHQIPSPRFGTFTDCVCARKFLAELDRPVVVKADGLAAGKGVLVCNAIEEAIQAIDECLVGQRFGAAGQKIVIEERLYGTELSLMVLSDGNDVVPLASAMDHKRVGDGDAGPNTGGMGALSQAPGVTPALERKLLETVILPTIDGMRRDGCPFTGILYAGLMMVDGEPRVLEFNTRLGDPETQPIMVRLQSDLYNLLLASTNGTLAGVTVEWRSDVATTVVLAAHGYPGKIHMGDAIIGVEQAERIEGVTVFHAGTAVRDGQLVTAGGRVLGVAALGCDLHQSRQRAYQAVEKISFAGMHYRRDIGVKTI